MTIQTDEHEKDTFIDMGNKVYPGNRVDKVSRSKTIKTMQPVKYVLRMGLLAKPHRYS